MPLFDKKKRTSVLGQHELDAVYLPIYRFIRCQVSFSVGTRCFPHGGFAPTSLISPSEHNVLENFALRITSETLSIIDLVAPSLFRERRFLPLSLIHCATIRQRELDSVHTENSTRNMGNEILSNAASRRTFVRISTRNSSV